MNNRFACAIAGAKGGVGKTTTSINLGASLAAAGYSTVTVELDLAMANLVDFLDVDIDVTEATTLHDVLAGECGVEAATYGTDSGLSVVPSGTDLQGYAETDLRRLPDVVETLRWHYDIVLLDTPAGLSEETVRPMQVADEVILVSTPRVASVRNVQNTKQLAERVDCDVRGLVLTKSGTGASPGADRVAEFLEVELLGHVPEDEAVPHSQDRGRPVVSNAPNSGASIAYRKIAMELVGAEREDLEHKGAPPSDGTAASGEESLQSDQAGSGGKRARPLEPTDGGTVVSPSTSSDAGVSDSRDPETTQGDRGDARESDEQPSHQEGPRRGKRQKRRPRSRRTPRRRSPRPTTRSTHRSPRPAVDRTRRRATPTRTSAHRRPAETSRVNRKTRPRRRNRRRPRRKATMKQMRGRANLLGPRRKRLRSNRLPSQRHPTRARPRRAKVPPRTQTRRARPTQKTRLPPTQTRRTKRPPPASQPPRSATRIAGPTATATGRRRLLARRHLGPNPTAKRPRRRGPPKTTRTRRRTPGTATNPSPVACCRCSVSRPGRPVRPLRARPRRSNRRGPRWRQRERSSRGRRAGR
ncbi:P-loop NTPase [Haloarcula regularis]|uniref:P-loop NTPase n=1 Tax=Haloarcula regularis TaxID=3033392 RepID=UPI0023E85613|nr:P-loop NTPase [Halomicroarcula sp. SYNS111]